MRLRDGKIVEYHEVANTAPAFVDIKFAPERIAKIVAKQGAALKARPEMKRHLVECSASVTGVCATWRRPRNPLGQHSLAEKWIPGSRFSRALE